MRLLDLFRFLLGDAEAIRTLAVNPWTLPVGAALVLSAGLARNYDTHDIRQQWWRLLLPFGASILAAAVLYVLIAAVRGAWLFSWSLVWGVVGLFWLTAPIAWLYGLPFERLWPPATAARTRLVALGVVSVCRVTITTRFVSVLCGCAWFEALLLVVTFTVPTALLAMSIASVVTRQPEARQTRRQALAAPGEASLVPQSARTVVGAMGGIPEDLPGPQPPYPAPGTMKLDYGADETSCTCLGCLAVVFLALSLLLLHKGVKLSGEVPPLPPAPHAAVPSPAVWGFAAAAVVFWGALALVRQPVQQRRTRLVEQMRYGSVEDAMHELVGLQPGDLPRGWDPSLVLARPEFASRMLEATRIAAALPAGSSLRSRFQEQMKHMIPVWVYPFDLWRDNNDRMPEAQLRDLSRLRDLLRGLPEGAKVLEPHGDYLEQISDYTRERDPPRHELIQDLLALKRGAEQ